MNAPVHTSALFGSILLPLDTTGMEEIGGLGVDRFISTSRTDGVVVEFLNHVFYEACTMGVSDVHFQNDGYGAVVRYRIDGHLQDEYRISHATSMAIDQKIRARCTVSQQDRESMFDGNFWLKLDDVLLDVRVSFVPTRFGENIVCRLLDQRNAERHIHDIEMPDHQRLVLMDALTEPEGIILITGPTGSGKTSTLYACLNHLNTRSVNIETAEDPVEYRLPGANQVAVSEKRTFPQILRSMLRQDFDIGLIGEVRDADTAQIAYQAANTGHLMFSTLHTNNAVSSAYRLIDLGVDMHSVVSSTKCIVAQRLPQKLCPYCKELHVLDDQEIHILDRLEYAGPRTFWTRNPYGCEHCRNGESGRKPILEMLSFTRQLQDALLEGDKKAVQLAAKAQRQYMPLVHAALNMCADGTIGFDRAIAMGGK